MLVAAWRLSTNLSEGGWRSTLPMGVLLGLMTLVKAQTWLFALAWAALVVLLVPTRRWPHAIRLAVVILVMFLTVLPWSIRNLNTFGTFVLVSTNGGTSLAVANHKNSTGTDAWTSHPDRAYIAQSVQDQIGADRRAREVTWRWIRENPGAFLALAPRKFWWALVPDGESEWGYQSGYAQYDRHLLAFRITRWINQGVYFLLAALSLWSTWRLLRHHFPTVRSHILPLGLPAGYIAMFLAVTFVFNGQSRYHFPLMPMLCAISAWALTLSRNPSR